jgi:hypothetical protein
MPLTVQSPRWQDEVDEVSNPPRFVPEILPRKLSQATFVQ